MPENIFTIMIRTLNEIPVAGEANLSKMLGVLSTLRALEAQVEEPEPEKESPHG